MTLFVSPHNHNLHNFSKNTNKERIEIHNSSRIFRNYKSTNIPQLDQKNIYLTLEDAKKGKIPIIDHILIVSLDIIKTERYRHSKYPHLMQNIG
jgi:hypothetical protein